MKLAIIADTRTSSVYGLHDPRVPFSLAALRYVGRAVDPFHRLSQHLTPCELRRKCRRCSWLIGLRQVGLRPAMVVLATVPFDDAPDAEIDWCARATAAGAKLTNDAPPGAGGSRPGSRRSPETRARIAAALRGNRNGLGCAKPREIAARVGRINARHGLRRAGLTVQTVRAVFACRGQDPRVVAERFGWRVSNVHAVWSGRRHSSITEST